MKNKSLRKQLHFFLILLFLVVISVWFIVQLQSSSNIKRITQDYNMQVTERIIDNLEMTFLDLEYTAVTISANLNVKDFVTEKNFLSYHEKAEKVSQFISNVYHPDGLVQNILIYDMDGIYYRFLGDLGSANAIRVGHLLEENNSAHIIITLTGTPYIGYLHRIYEDDKQIGYIVFLIKGSTIEDMFSRYDPTGYLKIGLVAGNNVIASNDKSLITQSTFDIEKDADFFRLHPISITPFEILLINDPSVHFENALYYLMFSILNLSLLITVIYFIYSWINRKFFNPMVQIISNVDEMGMIFPYRPLEITGEDSFDNLVYHINDMMRRSEEHSSEIISLQLEMHNTETEKQIAVIMALKKQINAHFIVNALNVIKRLAEKSQPDKAGEMCDNLAFLLRYANDSDEYISGLEEMFVLGKYSDIMKTRYPNRFKVIFEIDNKIDDIMLPRMLIQPILENAFTHAQDTPQKFINITISACIEDDCIIINVSDNGCGIDKEKLVTLQSNIQNALQFPFDNQGIKHISLQNIQKRILLMFGEGYGLLVDSNKDEGTNITITVPIF